MLNAKASVVIVISEFAELNKVQRPYLWPDDYSFVRIPLNFVKFSELGDYYYD